MMQPRRFGAPWRWNEATSWLLGIAAIFLLREAAPVMMPIAIALLLAFLLSGPVEGLRRVGVPEMLGAALVIICIAWGVVAVTGVLVKPALEWAADAPGNMARLLAAFERLREKLPLLKALAGNGGNAASFALLQQRIAGQLLDLARIGAEHAGTAGFGLIATIFLLYFMLISQRGLLPVAVASLPDRRSRAHLLTALRDVRDDIRRYLGVMVFMNALLGMTTAVAFHFIGLSQPVFWGILAASLNFVPYLGPATMYVLLFAAGVWQFDTLGMMFAPCIAFGIASVLESGIASPWLIGQRMRIHKLLVFLSVLFWAWMWGIGGTVVGVPILIGIRAALRGRYRSPLLGALLRPGSVPEPSLEVLLRDDSTDALGEASPPGMRDSTRIEIESRRSRRR